MRSAAVQTTATDPADYSAQKGSGEQSDARVSNTDEVASVRLPSFEYGDAWAASARRAGRLNAAHISEAEWQSLLSERQRLLDRKFEGSLTKQDHRRLEYVRWSLDRIEDAKHGEQLDRLDNAVARYEELRQDIAALMENLDSFRGRR